MPVNAVSHDQSLSYMYISQPDIKEVDVAQSVCSLLQNSQNTYVHLLNCRHVLFSLKPTEMEAESVFHNDTVLCICYNDPEW